MRARGCPGQGQMWSREAPRTNGTGIKPGRGNPSGSEEQSFGSHRGRDRVSRWFVVEDVVDLVEAQRLDRLRQEGERREGDLGSVQLDGDGHLPERHVEHRVAVVVIVVVGALRIRVPMLMAMVVMVAVVMPMVMVMTMVVVMAMRVEAVTVVVVAFLALAQQHVAEHPEELGCDRTVFAAAHHPRRLDGEQGEDREDGSDAAHHVPACLRSEALTRIP